MKDKKKPFNSDIKSNIDKAWEIIGDARKYSDLVDKLTNKLSIEPDNKPLQNALKAAEKGLKTAFDMVEKYPQVGKIIQKLGKAGIPFAGATALLSDPASAAIPGGLEDVGASPSSKYYSQERMVEDPAYKAGPQREGFIQGGKKNEYAGDRIDARLNKGELVLNARQQQNLVNAVNGKMPIEEVGNIIEPASSSMVLAQNDVEVPKEKESIRAAMDFLGPRRTREIMDSLPISMSPEDKEFWFRREALKERANYAAEPAIKQETNPHLKPVYANGGVVVDPTFGQNKDLPESMKMTAPVERSIPEPLPAALDPLSLPSSGATSALFPLSPESQAALIAPSMLSKSISAIPAVSTTPATPSFVNTQPAKKPELGQGMKDLEQKIGKDAVASSPSLVQQVADNASKKAIEEEVDEQDFWASKSTPQKIGLGIAMALGAVGAAMAKTENFAQKFIMHAIDTDLEKQKLGAAEKKQKQIQAMEIAKAKIEQERFNRTDAKDQQRLALEAKRLGIEIQKLQNAEMDKDLVKLSFSAINDPNAPQSKKQEALMHLPAPLQERAVTNYKKDIVGLAPNTAARNNLQEKEVAAAGVISALDELRELSKVASSTNLSDRQRVAGKVSTIIGNARPSLLGPGTMQKFERDIIESKIGNIVSMSPFYKIDSQLKMIDDFRDEIIQGLEKEYSTNSLPLKYGVNEANVQALRKSQPELSYTNAIKKLQDKGAWDYNDLIYRTSYTRGSNVKK